MKVFVRYEAARVEGIVEASPDLPEVIWNRIKDAARITDDSTEFQGRSFIMPWASTLALIRGIAPLQRLGELRFAISPDGEEAKSRIASFVADMRAVQALRGRLVELIPESEIQGRLDELGFSRKLEWHQRRDIARLVSIPQGANFSVPGAGKTTVAYATHLLTRREGTRLLVVAPKNAFGAWDDIIRDAIRENAPHGASAPFVRLSTRGVTKDEMNAQHLLVGYDTAHRIMPDLTYILAHNPFHVILDESHRIKAGERSLRGNAMLRIATLPVRKDILSGTPAPNGKQDLEPQLEFLWPGQTLAADAAIAESPKEVLANLYVRTTKQDLGLPKATRIPYNVSMGDAQVALYAALKGFVVKRLQKYNKASPLEQLRARRCVVYLLQCSSNPSATVRALTKNADEEYFSTPELENLYRAVLAQGDSNKLKEVARMARAINEERGKVVIWSVFLENIFRLEELLADLNPVTLFGDVPTGDYLDPNTREGRVQRFKTDDSCRVVIANPAAASEGISLHQASQDAIYVDRSYNAAHYLQSVDRIHRLGLPPDATPRIHVVRSTTPKGLASIDHAVSLSLARKIRTLEQILDDEDLKELALDEERANVPVDDELTLADVEELLASLMNDVLPDEDEMA